MTAVLMLGLLFGPAAGDDEEVEVRVGDKVYRVRMDDAMRQRLREQGQAPVPVPERSSPAPPRPGVDPGPARPPAEPPQALLVAVAGLGAALVGLAVYAFILAPRARERPLREAAAILAADNVAAFVAAERLLVEGLTAGLRRRAVREARFALAYVRARLGRHSEALAVLGDLARDSAPTADEAYLRLWLHAQKQEHDLVERTFSEHRALLADYRDARQVAGASYLHLAMDRWARKDVAGAVQFFERLRELGVLTAEIPEQIDDHQVVLGVAALFERDTAEAEERFAAAVAAAEEHGRSPLSGQLGLLLCQWRATANPDIDADLAAVVKALGAPPADAAPLATTACPHCRQAARVPKRYFGRRVACRSCRRKFVAEEAPDEPPAAPPAAKPLPRLLDDADQLRRAVRVWFAVSRMFGWRRLAAKGGLPDKERQVLARRAAAARQVTPDAPEPDLIDGLVAYYFAPDDAARTGAVELLDEAAGKGVNLPGVLHLITRERRLGEIRRDSLTRLLALARSHLVNPGIPKQTRARLQTLLARFGSARDLTALQLPDGDGEATRIQRELQERTEQTRRRVAALVKAGALGAAAKDGQTIDQLLAAYGERNEALGKEAAAMEAAEADLVRRLVEAFSEEPPPPAAPALAATELVWRGPVNRKKRGGGDPWPRS